MGQCVRSLTVFSVLLLRFPALLRSRPRAAALRGLWGTIERVFLYPGSISLLLMVVELIIYVVFVFLNMFWCAVPGT